MEKILIGNIEILKFVFNPLKTNCYLINGTDTTIIVDPSCMFEREVNELVNEIKHSKLFIINTHGHFDHIAGNSILKEMFKDSTLLIHKLDSDLLKDPNLNASNSLGFEIVSTNADIIMENGTMDLLIGGISLKCVHTPGHTKGSISIIGDGFVFTGDTLFAGTVGIAKEYQNAFNDLIHSIKTKLLVLEDHFVVLPGHMESSTIGEERNFNPFLL